MLRKKSKIKARRRRKTSFFTGLFFVFYHTMHTPFFNIYDEATPCIATALHDGHAIDKALRPFLLLNEQERSREEDPYTWYLIDTLPVTRIKVSTSRFQLDLNRTRDKSVYQQPEDAWGLHVWRKLPPMLLQNLYKDYDFFYDTVFSRVRNTIETFGKAVILDVHSYNHRRENAEETAPESTHPEINIGSHYNHSRWNFLCEAYTSFLQKQEIGGKRIDARENIIFKGGAFSQQLIETFGASVCVLSIELKKTFMDEWTGVADIDHILSLKNLIQKSVSFLIQESNS